jgi:adenosylcobyric acid synthase
MNTAPAKKLLAKKSAKTLMVQGTTSDAGKTTLVAALCRILARQNKKVAPFKPQNMALNSAVTRCGGEIGRAQAVQARAANIAAEVDFNPILLKPNSDTGAQVIIHGKAITDMQASAYHDYKKIAMQAVLTSHQRLSERFDYIMVEGAGSPAEINLRAGDIANMGFAEAVDCPVILIADIDRGGVFAHLVGTLELLSQSEQQRVVGFVINRFRGDIALLQSGLDWLEERTGKPVLGVLPYLHGLKIAAEDAVDAQQVTATPKLKVIVVVYPRMSNHNDFDALRWHKEIDLTFVYASSQQKTALPAADLIILPGSKNVRADLDFLIAQGWHHDIAKHLRYGGKIWGICGGYQMLGADIADPLAIEGKPGTSAGLNYLPISTTLTMNKTLTNVSGELSLNNQTAAISGYEIHAGQSQIISTEQEPAQPVITVNNETSGLVSCDGQVAGCYLHGIFDQSEALQLIMQWCGANVCSSIDHQQQENIALDKLADACQQHLDLTQLNEILNSWRKNNG